MPSTISAGTTAGTAIAIAGDTTGNLAFQTNGTTTAMTIDTSQNVGIGTTSPGSILELKSATPVLRINGTSQASTRGIAFQDNGVTRGSLTHNSDSGATTLSSGDAGNGYFLAFRTDNAERMRIDSSGNVLVNTTSVSTWGGRVSIAHDSSPGFYPFAINNTAAGSNNLIVEDFYRNGTRTGYISNTNSATTYSTSSDYRLKENIAPMTGALAKVAQLKPVTYNWKVDGSAGQGFIAHELAEVCPDAVSGEKDAVDKNGNPEYQGVDTSFLVATLTAAIQELKAELDATKAEVQALKGVA